MLDWSGYEMIPANLRGGIERYYDRGIAPGGFLTRVLENDLLGAVSHADDVSLTVLPDLVKFMYNRMPIGSFGDRESVSLWMLNKRTQTA